MWRGELSSRSIFDVLLPTPNKLHNRFDILYMISFDKSFISLYRVINKPFVLMLYSPVKTISFAFNVLDMKNIINFIYAISFSLYFIINSNVLSVSLVQFLCRYSLKREIPSSRNSLMNKEDKFLFKWDIKSCPHRNIIRLSMFSI